MWNSIFSNNFLKRLPIGLALALMLSLLFHFFILGGEYWHLPSLDLARSNSPLQQVHLQAAPVAELPPAPKPSSVQREKKSRIEPESVKPPVPADDSVTVAEEPVMDSAGGDMTGEETLVMPEEPALASSDQQDAALSSDEAGVAGDADTVMHDMPAFTYVDTDFVVLRGENGNKVGVTHIRYRMHENGKYELTSTTEAKGFAALVISGKLLQHSEGSVTEHGLRPEYFSYQYGKGDNKKQQSRFDWEQHKITLETAKGVKTIDLPEGSQDLLSFMYQFLFLPPLEEMTLHISNGKKLSEYNYSFEGEETLNTEFGAVRSWHITRAGDEGSEKTELWLAVDYHYLPVKMRKTEEDGSVIEQVATQISTDLLK